MLKAIQLSIGACFNKSCDNLGVNDIETINAEIRPINLPNSSIRPLLKPLMPIKIKKRVANKSMNHDIYESNSLKILLATLPSTLPLPHCITFGITIPISPILLAPVSEMIVFTRCRVSSISIIFGR